MLWLAQQSQLDDPSEIEVLLPEELIPDSFDGSERDARLIMTRLCDHMQIEENRVQLEILPDVYLPEASAHYDRQPGKRSANIRVTESTLENSYILASTLAHELAHEILLGGGLLDESVSDHEWITDLLPVYLGLGIFMGNSTIVEEYCTHGGFGWSAIGKIGYLPGQIYGYALALFAFFRGENNPPWAAYLRTDTANTFERGVRFLQKTADSLFHPDTAHIESRAPTPDEATSQFLTGSPWARLATLWDIRKYALTSTDYLSVIMRALKDNDEIVVSEAARTIAIFGDKAIPVIPMLRHLIFSTYEDISVSASAALGVLRLAPEQVVPDLCALECEPNSAAFLSAVWALGQYGIPLEERSLQRLLVGMEQALVAQNLPAVEIVAQMLLAVSEAPEAVLRAHLAQQDVEIRQQALDILAEQRVSPGTWKPIDLDFENGY